MHMRGTPQTMQTMTRYDDLTGEVLAYFVEKIGWLRGEGVTQIVLDPGFGFSKTVEQNFRLLGEMHRLGELGYPVLAGISRKSMIYKTLDTTPGRRPRRHDGAALGMPASGRIDPARARHARGGANRRAVRTVRTIQ